MSAFELSDPRRIRVEMMRSGIAPNQFLPWDDPERGYVDPLDGDEERAVIRGFLSELWQACEREEQR